MSAGSIFEAETKSRFDGKIALIAIAAFLTLDGAGYIAYRLSERHHRTFFSYGDFEFTF